MDTKPSQNSWKGFPFLAGRCLGWGEVFVLIPLHIFWTMFKSTPFGAENRASLLVILVPFAAVLIAGMAMQRAAWRRAFVRAEWLFHLTSAVLATGLLVSVVLRDPFDPVLPLTWPLCVWSVWLAFTLLGNVAAHERTGAARQSPFSLKDKLLVCALGGGLWLALLPLASAMAWAPYYWTVSAVFHALMAPLSRRGAANAQSVPRLPSRRMAGVASVFEGALGGGLMLLALLQLLFACDMVGAAEVRYPQVVALCASPWFVAGVALAVVTRGCRAAFLGHGLAVLAAFLVRDADWTISAFLGYGLAVLFLAAMRSGALAYAAMGLVAAFVWVLGLFGFMLAGVIIVFQVGAGLADFLLVRTRLALLVLVCLWLVLAAIQYWHSKRIAGRGQDDTGCGRLGYGWAYAATWLVVAVPIAILAVSVMWPPVFFARSAQIAVGEASGICHAGYTKSAEEYGQLNKLGARCTRIPIYWGQLEPAPGEWNYSEPDAFLDAAEKHGVGVLAVLGFDNNAVELSETGKARGGYFAYEDMPLYLEYVRRAVERYQDRVYAWEIWNEPDLPLFWTGTMEEFYVIARETAKTIRETDPDAIIIGTATTSLLGLYSTPGIEGLHRTGALELVDHPAMHTYVSDSRGFYNEFRRVQNAARKHGHPGPVWITELGAPDGGVYPWCVATGLRAEYASKAYTISTRMGIDRLFWHCYLDAPVEIKQREPLNSEHFFGLVEPDGQWKPAAYAYQLFAKHCNDSSIRMDLVDTKGGLAARQLRTALYRRDNGDSALVMWFEPGLRQHGRARVRVDLGDLSQPALVHDVASGYRKPLVDGIIDATEKPVFVTYSAGGPEALVRLDVDGSPVDASWCVLLVVLVLASTIACRGKGTTSYGSD